MPGYGVTLHIWRTLAIVMALWRMTCQDVPTDIGAPVLFSYFDKDGNGLLSAEEVDAAFEERHVGASDAMDDAKVLVAELSGGAGTGADISEHVFRTYLYAYFGKFCWNTPAWTELPQVRDLCPDPQ